MTRTRKILLTITAALGSIVMLFALAAPSMATDQPVVPDIRNCQAMQDEADKQTQEAGAAKAALDDAKAAVAIAEKGVEDAEATRDDPATETNERDEAIRQATVALNNAKLNLDDAQKEYDKQQAEADDAQAKADEACLVPPGTPGKDGEPGKDGADGVDGQAGKDGVDAVIVLRPNVCARALVTPNEDRLVRVVVLVPCPRKVDAPANEPKPGQKVIVIEKTAPKPRPVQSDLPVTG